MKRVVCNVILGSYLLGSVALSPAVSYGAEDCAAASKLVAQGSKAAEGSRQEEDNYRKAIALCPRLANAYYNLALALQRQGRLDEALANLTQAKSYSSDPEILLAIANTQVMLGHLPIAEEIYQRLLTGGQVSTKAQQGLAVVLERQGKLDEAEENLRAAIQLAPSDSSLFFNLGMVLERKGDLLEASRSFRTAGEKRSKFTDAVLAEARALLMLGDVERTEQVLTQAEKWAQKDPRVWNALGSLAARQGDQATARLHFERALAIGGESTESLSSLAVVLYKLKDREGGKRRSEEALRLFPESSSSHAASGWIALQEGDLERANRELHRALELDPQDAQVVNNLGVLALQRGNASEARSQFIKSLELNPRLEEAQMNLDRLK